MVAFPRRLRHTHATHRSTPTHGEPDRDTLTSQQTNRQRQKEMSMYGYEIQTLHLPRYCSMSCCIVEYHITLLHIYFDDIELYDAKLLYATIRCHTIADSVVLYFILVLGYVILLDNVV